MYVPPHFREERVETLLTAIRDIQLASLVTAGPNGLAASHLPMVAKDEGGLVRLEGHFARQNDHWRVATDGPVAALAIFQGPQAYVSPSWYATKREHGKVVPTWNYVAVQAHGMLELVEDPDWLAAHLDDLTDANEAGRPQPWGTSDAPGDFIRNLSRAIVGVRLRVETLEGAWKMIQHRSDGDRAGTIAGLSAEPGSEARTVADVMRTLEIQRAETGPT